MNRQEMLRIVAKGRCSAAERRFGFSTKYLPSIDGMICQLSEAEDECFDSKKAAKDAAIEFRDEARQRLHDEFGG